MSNIKKSEEFRKIDFEAKQFPGETFATRAEWVK